MQKQLDLLIINPCGAEAIYGALARSLTAIEPPQWARLIAGFVRAHGYSVRIIDAEAETMRPNEVAAAVRRTNPRLVCIAAYGHQPSASTQMMAAAGDVARAIDATEGTTTIMLGGHVSALPERTLQEEQITFACKGEGPVTVLGLLRGDDLRSIPGLVWRDVANGHAVINPAAPLLQPAELENPAWDLLPMERYRSHNWQAFGDPNGRTPYASIWTTLGCPYRCSFCCINAPFGQTPSYRMRDPYMVVDEIARLYRDGVTTFKITDEMFILNERHYTAIAEGLIGAGLGARINIWAYARIDTIKPETLAMLRAAGFRWLALGIESGSKHVRDGARKRLKHDDIIGTVRAIQDAGIHVIANYIFGLPDDDLISMSQTLRLAGELNTEFANFYCAMAYPGSPLYDEAIAKGWHLPDTWLGYSQHSYQCRPLNTQTVQARDVLAFRDAAHLDYFQHPRYLDMIERKFGVGTRNQVYAMTRQRLRRRLLDDEKVTAL